MPSLAEEVKLTKGCRQGENKHNRSTHRHLNVQSTRLLMDRLNDSSIAMLPQKDRKATTLPQAECSGPPTQIRF